MIYADKDYYINTFKGAKISESDIDNQLRRASDEIDSLTFNKIVGIGFENLTEFQKDKIKKSVCLHAEFKTCYGEYIDSPISSFSAGSTSVSFNGEVINGITTSKEVINILKQTGLMCRRL